MTKVQFGVLTGLLAVIAALLVAPIMFPHETAPRWEYRIEGIKDFEFVSELNRFGGGGWEIASARRAVMGTGEDSEGIYEVIFKRPK